MSYTKRQLVAAAFSEIGLGDYSFDIPPEQKEEALRRLDAMLADWSIRGIRLGYPLPGSPENSNIDDETGIPLYAERAVICNLALEIAPSIGKRVSMQTIAAASSGMNTIMAVSAKPREMRLPEMPSGAGNKCIETPFIGGDKNERIERPESSVSFV